MKSFFVSVIALVAFSFMSCQQATSGSPSSNDPIVGTWTITSYQTTVGGSFVTPASQGMTTDTVTFTSVNAWTGSIVGVSSGTAYSVSAAGTWSKDGSTYTIIQTGYSYTSSGTTTKNTTQTTTTATISGSTLTATDSAGKQTIASRN